MKTTPLTETRRPIALLLDGVPADDTLAAGLVTVDPYREDPDLSAELIARGLSKMIPHGAVALARLGDPESLRRFVAGVEVTR